jgi:hypothetical protein
MTTCGWIKQGARPRRVRQKKIIIDGAGEAALTFHARLDSDGANKKIEKKRRADIFDVVGHQYP